MDAKLLQTILKGSFRGSVIK